MAVAVPYLSLITMVYLIPFVGFYRLPFKKQTLNAYSYFSLLLVNMSLLGKSFFI